MSGMKLVTVKEAQCDGFMVMHLSASTQDSTEHHFKIIDLSITWGENAKAMLTQWAIDSGYSVEDIIGHYPLIATVKLVNDIRKNRGMDPVDYKKEKTS